MTSSTYLEARVAPRRRPTAAALSLIGGGARPWDVRRGITAPAQFRLLDRRMIRETAVRAR